MKAIRIPVFVLVLLLTLSVCNAVYLTGRCALWEQQLAEAHRAADAGQTADAAAARPAQTMWTPARPPARQPPRGGYNP